MATLREQIDSASDQQLEAVPVPEWNMTVFVRNMDGTERDAWESETYTIQKGEVVPIFANLRARLLVRCLCDEAGVRLYSDNEAAVLGRKSGAVLDRLYIVARRINALSSEDIEALEKN